VVVDGSVRNNANYEYNVEKRRELKDEPLSKRLEALA
jgi:hypothetical protein